MLRTGKRSPVQNRTTAELHRMADDAFARVMVAIGGG
jgi:hypothetical protein